MVGFIIEYNDVFHAHQLTHDPLQHLPFRLQGMEGFAAPAGQKRPARAGKLGFFAQLERMIIGDDHPGPLDVAQHIRRHQLARLVVAFRIGGQKHAEPILDGNAGRDHQKAVGKAFAARVTHGVDSLPGYEHGHDRGFACAGGKLQGQTRQAGVSIIIGVLQIFEKLFPAFAILGRDLRQPDGCFHRFQLTEERTDAAKFMMPPVLQQTPRFGGDLPGFRVREGTPGCDCVAQLVDARGQFIFLLLGG